MVLLGLVVVALVVMLAALRDRDAVDRLAVRYPSPFSAVSGLRIHPVGDRVAVYGVLKTEPEQWPTFALEIISLGDRQRALLSDLPGSVRGVDWTPEGERLVASVISEHDPRDVPLDVCGHRTALMVVSPEGEVIDVLELDEVWDFSGLVMVDDRFAMAFAFTPGPCESIEGRLVRVDLESGAVEDLGSLRGSGPVRGAGGIVYIEGRRLRWLDPETLASRTIDTPGIEVLDAAASDGSVIVFRGFEEVTGEAAGLYSIDLEVGPESLDYFLSTVLNRPSLDASGRVLVGHRLHRRPGSNYIAVLELSG